jgi:hypothetical protein
MLPSFFYIQNISTLTPQKNHTFQLKNQKHTSSSNHQPNHQNNQYSHNLIFQNQTQKAILISVFLTNLN